MKKPITARAAFSRGLTHDFEWQSSDGAKLDAPPITILLDDEQPSLALDSAGSGGFMLLVEGLDAGRFDRTDRSVRNGILFEIESEFTARALVAAFLRDWPAREKEIAACITAEIDAPLGWRWNSTAIEGVATKLAAAQPNSRSASHPLPNRLQRNHAGPGSPAWSELADEVTNYSLPATLGATLVVTGYPSLQGRERAEQTAVRFLYRGASPLDLETLAKKKPQATSSVSTGLSGRSWPTNPPEHSGAHGTGSGRPWSMLSWLISAGRRHPVPSVILGLLVGWGIGLAIKKKGSELVSPPAAATAAAATPAAATPAPATPAPATPAPATPAPATPAPVVRAN